MAFQAKKLLKVCIHVYSFRSVSEKFQFNRKARFLGKMFAENRAERKQWSLGLPTHKIYGASCLSPKRLETLNKIFLANITDALTTSSRCNELADLGLLVSRAELSKCGQSVKVMWSTCSPECDEKVASILEECKGELCHNIITKSVGGYIPHIIFSKDLRATSARSVEFILNLPSVRRDLDSELSTKEDAEHKEEEEDRFKVELSTSILGLKRDAILGRIMANVKRLRKMNQKEKEEGEIYNNEETPDRLGSIDGRKQKSAIGAFIKKRAKLEQQKFLYYLEASRKECEDEYAGGSDELLEDIDEDKYDHDFMNLEGSSLDETKLENNEKETDDVKNTVR